MKEIILKVEGMMCNGCETRVQNTLGNIEGIKEVNASHTNKTVKVILEKDVSINLLKEKIEDLGYEVVE